MIQFRPKALVLIRQVPLQFAAEAAQFENKLVCRSGHILLDLVMQR